MGGEEGGGGRKEEEGGRRRREEGGGEGKEDKGRGLRELLRGVVFLPSVSYTRVG